MSILHYLSNLFLIKININKCQLKKYRAGYHFQINKSQCGQILPVISTNFPKKFLRIFLRFLKYLIKRFPSPMFLDH